MNGYATKLRELEKLFSNLGGGSGSNSSTQLDTTLRAATALVTDLQETADRLKGQGSTGTIDIYIYIEH